MKLYTFFTRSHKPMFDEFVAPMASREFEIVACYDEASPQGNFGQKDFKAATKRKARHMLRAVQENQGDVVVWCDADVAIFRPLEAALLQYARKHDIAAQRASRRGRPRLNSGFYVVRANERTLALFEDVAADPRCVISPSGGESDQRALNHYLREHKEVRATMLPDTFWHYGLHKEREWMPCHPIPELPAGIHICHACYCRGVKRKTSLLRCVRRFVQQRNRI